MNKTKWYTRALYLVFALALVLLMVPATVFAAATGNIVDNDLTAQWIGPSSQMYVQKATITNPGGAGSLDIDCFAVTNTAGTAVDADVTEVAVYDDTGGTTPGVWDATDPLIGSAASFTAAAAIGANDGAACLSVGTGVTTIVFVVVTTAAIPTDGHTFQTKIDGSDLTGGADTWDGTLGIVTATSAATIDFTAPTLDNAVVIGENLVRVEMNDTGGSGFAIATIQPADFTVDGSTVTAVATYKASNYLGLADSDTDAVIHLTTSQTLSPGEGVKVEITNASLGIADMVGNAITSGSFETLGLSVTPSQVTLGDSVTLTGQITRGGSAYTGTAYWAVIGLENAPGGTTCDDDIEANTNSPLILAKGSTTSGTFATAMTLDGLTAVGKELERNYLVLISTENVFGAVGTKFDSPEVKAPVWDGEDIINETVTHTFMGTGVLVMTVTGTIDSLGALSMGDSAIVSGSLKKADDTGISGYTVRVTSVEGSGEYDLDYGVVKTPTAVGTTTTAGNGNFATSAIFDDAGIYAVTYPAYFADPRQLVDDHTHLEADTIHDAIVDTFEVGPLSLAASTNTATALSKITVTAGVELKVLIDGAAPGAGHITRFKLSGINIDSIDVAQDNVDIIEQVTFTNGDSFGGVTAAKTSADDAKTAADATAGLSALAYVATADDNEDSDIDTTGNAVDISSLVLCAKDGDNKIAFDVQFSGDGTLSIEGQVEDTTDDADSPKYPDYVGTTSMTVTAAERLNALPSITTFGVDLVANGAQDNFNLKLEILNVDGQGIIEDTDNPTNPLTADDSPADNKEIDTYTITLTTTGTEFSLATPGPVTVGGTNVGDIVINTDYEVSKTGASLTETEFSLIADSARWSDVQNEELKSVQFNALSFEQAGTLTVDIEANFHNGDKVSKTLNYDIAGESVVVTPTSATVADVKDVEITITKDGIGRNTRFVGLVPADAAALSVDKDGDGVYGEAGEIYTEVWYNPLAEQLEDQTATKIKDADPVAEGLYDFGDVKFLKVTKVDVQVRKTNHAGELTALLTEQINIAPEAVYTLTPDVTSVVAGIANQVDLTVTQDGMQVTGATLNELMGNLAAKQATTALAAPGKAIVSDKIRLTNLRPEDVRSDGALVPVTISVATNDGLKGGSVDITAVEPGVALTIDGVAEAEITRGFIEPVSMTITDPRDSSEIAAADLRVVANNLEVQMDSSGDVFTTEAEASGIFNNLGLLLDGTGAGATSDVDTAANSATYEFDAIAYSLDAGEEASIVISVCDDGATWIEVGTVSIVDATATITPDAVVVGQQSYISIENAVDAHGQPLVDENARLFMGAMLASGTLDEDGGVTFVLTPTATGTILAQVQDDTGAWQTLGTVGVALKVLESIEALPAAPSINVGETQQLIVTATYGDATTDVVTTSVDCTYVSDAPTIATVTTPGGGLITGLAEGLATITVSYTEDTVTKTDTVAVTVGAPPVPPTPEGYDDPIYGGDGDGIIDLDELLNGIEDYLGEETALSFLLDVIELYLSP